MSITTGPPGPKRSRALLVGHRALNPSRHYGVRGEVAPGGEKGVDFRPHRLGGERLFPEKKKSSLRSRGRDERDRASHRLRRDGKRLFYERDLPGGFYETVLEKKMRLRGLHGKTGLAESVGEKDGKGSLDDEASYSPFLKNRGGDLRRRGRPVSLAAKPGDAAREGDYLVGGAPLFAPFKLEVAQNERGLSVAFEEYDGVRNEESRSVVKVRVGFARIDYEVGGPAHVEILRCGFFANQREPRILLIFLTMRKCLALQEFVIAYEFVAV